MNLTFEHGRSANITFKVAIAGTAAEPQSVFVSFSQGNTTSSFNATKIGEDYSVDIDFPGYLLQIGEANFSINVKINDRIFTPFKGTASLVAPQELATTLPEPEILAQQTEADELPYFGDAVVPEIKTYEGKKPIMSLIKMVEPKKPAVKKIITPTLEETFSIKKIKVIFK